MSTTTKLLCVGAIVGPFACMTIYTVLVHGSGMRPPPEWDYAALIASVICGTTCVGLLPVSWLLRTLLVAAYLPIVAYLLFFFTFALYVTLTGDGP